MSLILMQVPYLGQRLVNEKGKAGPYHWLSYAEVSKTRTEIGSGLLHHGLKSGSTLGLYSVNCRGVCPPCSPEEFSSYIGRHQARNGSVPSVPVQANLKVYTLHCRLGACGVCKRILLHCDCATL